MVVVQGAIDSPIREQHSIGAWEIGRSFIKAGERIIIHDEAV